MRATVHLCILLSASGNNVTRKTAERSTVLSSFQAISAGQLLVNISNKNKVENCFCKVPVRVNHPVQTQREAKGSCKKSYKEIII